MSNADYGIHKRKEDQAIHATNRVIHNIHIIFLAKLECCYELISRFIQNNSNRNVHELKMNIYVSVELPCLNLRPFVLCGQVKTLAFYHFLSHCSHMVSVQCGSWWFIKPWWSIIKRTWTPGTSYWYRHEMGQSASSTLYRALPPKRSRKIKHVLFFHNSSWSLKNMSRTYKNVLRTYKNV